MTTPICPIHKTEMKESRTAGQFYCPKKIGTGPKDYCTERATIQQAPSAAQAGGAGPLPATATPDATQLGPWALAAACVAFAGTLQTTDPQEATTRVQAAAQMYHAMKGLIGS